MSKCKAEVRCTCEIKRNNYGYPVRCLFCHWVHAEHAEMLETLKKLQEGFMFMPAIDSLIARIEGSDNGKA